MTFLYVRTKGNLFLYYNEVYDYWAESESEGTVFTRDDRNSKVSRFKDGFFIKARPR